MKGRPRKNPYDMAFATLMMYFYAGSVDSFNWVFPIDNTPFIKTKAERLHFLFHS
jgi:hypothetical protein